jgi:hypothetical protein
MTRTDDAPPPDPRLRSAVSPRRSTSEIVPPVAGSDCGTSPPRFVDVVEAQHGQVVKTRRARREQQRKREQRVIGQGRCRAGWHGLGCGRRSGRVHGRRRAAGRQQRQREDQGHDDAGCDNPVGPAYPAHESGDPATQFAERILEEFWGKPAGEFAARRRAIRHLHV